MGGVQSTPFIMTHFITAKLFTTSFVFAQMYQFRFINLISLQPGALRIMHTGTQTLDWGHINFKTQESLWALFFNRPWVKIQ